MAEITLDDLTSIVGAAVKTLHKEMLDMEGRLRREFRQEIDGARTEMGTKIDGVRTEMRSMTRRLERRMRRVEAAVNGMKMGIASHERRFRSIARVALG